MRVKRRYQDSQIIHSPLYASSHLDVHLHNSVSAAFYLIQHLAAMMVV